MNKAVQIMINKLKTQCLTMSLDRDINNFDVEGDVADTKTFTNVQMECCQWRGTIGEWKEHSEICEFVMVDCTECHSFNCQRKELALHHEECPEKKIPCPLSCGRWFIGIYI